MMMLTLMLTSKGVAGVPRASLVILTATLTTFGLPLEGAAHSARRRSDPRHGPDGRERHGQLHRDGRRRALGRRVRRRPDAPVQGGMTPKVRVSYGAAGQLGQRDGAPPVARDHAVVGARRDADLDLTNHAAVVLRRRARAARRSFSTARPTTPWTRPRMTSPTALAVNAFAVPVARSCRPRTGRHARALQHRLRVRRHTRRHPYVEEDAPTPQSVYGQSKLLGEWLRPGRAARLRAARGESLRRAPPEAASIASSTALASERAPASSSIASSRPASWTTSSTRRGRCCRRDAAPGLYHCVNAGETTWYALGEEAARLLQTAATSRCRPRWPTCRCAPRGRSTARYRMPSSPAPE